MSGDGARLDRSREGEEVTLMAGTSRLGHLS